MQQLTSSKTALPRLLTLEQVAAHLGMAVGTVYRLARSGRIPATKLGGSWRVAEPALAHMFDHRPNHEARTA